MASQGIKAPGNTPGPTVNRLPHLIKWIKHRVTPKKDGSSKFHDKSRDSELDSSYTIDNVLTSISKETLESSSSGLLDTTLASSTTSFSANTIVSDSSYDADINKDKLLTCGLVRSDINLNPTAPFDIVVNSGKNYPDNNNTMGVMQNLHPATPFARSCNGEQMTVCKHGCLVSKCRACMRLPPLPPGSERVLRELQRQAKQKLRSQSQVHFGSTGNINASPKLGHQQMQPHTTENMGQNRHSMHLHSSQFYNWQCAALQQQQQHKQMQQQQQSMHHSNTVPRNMAMAAVPNVHPANITTDAQYHSNSSPSEHVYEEIPEVFFKRDFNTPQQKFKHHTNIKSNNNLCDVRDSKQIQRDNTNEGKLMNKSNVHSVKREYCVAPDVTAVNALKSHEFYPQNMHSSQAEKGSNANPSRQVSLGNLDFGMAKECDGFLVVPLRDRTTNNTSETTGFHTDHRKQWIKNQAFSDNNTSIAPTQVHSNVTIPTQPVLTKSSSSNKVPETICPPVKIVKSENNPIPEPQQDSKELKYSSHVFQPIYSHARTHSVDAVNSQTAEKYTHCQKCSRPHGVYHGVSLCHTEVDDIRNELQYLDIAGLERKLPALTKPSVPDSPSLLQNFARRRSAFAKYIPSSQKIILANKEQSCKDHESVVVHNKGDSNPDSYKRQSMSTESDYFSSNYNTSQSDSLSRTSKGGQSQAAVTYTASSDKSNDTYSEYDIGPETNLKKEDSVGSTEYKFYLEKIKQNLKIKQEVQKIIRSSESERSDCENKEKQFQEDNISLTSVTSLSELSTMPFEESYTSFVRLRTCHKTSTKGSPKQSKHSASKSATDILQDAELLKMQRTRKPIRKKRKSSKDIEYYKLPNFVMKSQVDNSKKSDISICSEYKVPSSIYGDREDHSSDKQDSSSCYSADSVKGSEKLSCRVTDFRLSDIKRNNSVSNKNLSVRAINREVDDLKVTRASQSLYGNHNQVKNNSNNRLLSDLMKMNHDRQLFQFI